VTTSVPSSDGPTAGVLVAADLVGVHTGEVEAFDDAAGLGTVRHVDGQRLAFHCTAIADGTRMIDVGTRVAFVVATAHNGTVEARSMVSVS
jgi:cold shock CspA family protein